jgi:hypothetical protein
MRAEGAGVVANFSARQQQRGARAQVIGPTT